MLELILKLIDLIPAGTAAYGSVMKLRADLETMKAEGRDPLPDEWAAMFASIDAASADLDAADRRLNPVTTAGQ